MPGNRLPGEFELIRRYFAPLAKDVPGALNLTDDACTLRLRSDRELVVTADVLVAGVHFLRSDPPDRIARKMLRVNLSDLAAKGAKPIGYLMTLSLDNDIDEDWIKSFVDGLAEDQESYDLALLGGDTVMAPGPLSLSLTAIGTVPIGQAVRRSGAKPGDRIIVTGTIGDGYLGLRASRGEFADLPGSSRRYLIDRYQLPEPRVGFGITLGEAGLANAGMDVSDGLLGDLAHICKASGCGASVTASALPLSQAASDLLSDDPELLASLMTGGDDYELLLAVSPGAVEKICELARQHKVKATDIGTFEGGQGVRVLDREGEPIDIEVAGFTHF